MTTIRTTETFYVTKYALTEGIMVVKPGDGWLDEDGQYLYVGELGRMPIQVRRMDFHKSLDEAKKRVGFLVYKKLKSLNKKIEKLQKYEPPVKECKGS